MEVKKPTFVGRMSADFENIGAFYISLEHFKSVCQQNCWSISFEGECNFYTQWINMHFNIPSMFVWNMQKQKEKERFWTICSIKEQTQALSLIVGGTYFITQCFLKFSKVPYYFFIHPPMLKSKSTIKLPAVACLC